MRTGVAMDKFVFPGIHKQHWKSWLALKQRNSSMSYCSLVIYLYNSGMHLQRFDLQQRLVQRKFKQREGHPSYQWKQSTVYILSTYFLLVTCHTHHHGTQVPCYLSPYLLPLPNNCIQLRIVEWGWSKAIQLARAGSSSKVLSSPLQVPYSQKKVSILSLQSTAD